MILTDSLLSIKYILWNHDLFGYESMQDSILSPFEDSKVYRNDYALPLGYNVSENMESIEFGENPYDNQKRLVDSMLGEDSKIYNAVDMTYKGEDGDRENWELRTSLDGEVYLYINSQSVHKNLYADNCEIYVNGIYQQDCCSRFNMNSMYLGEFHQGDIIQISIKHKTSDQGQHVLYAAQLDEQAFVDAIEKLQNGSESHLTVKGNICEGTYTTSQNTKVFLSIPYEKSWTAYVDGEKTQIISLADTFIGLELTAGTHEIKLVYETPGLKAGACLSVLGVIGFIGISAFSYRRKRINN